MFSVSSTMRQQTKFLFYVFFFMKSYGFSNDSIKEASELV